MHFEDQATTGITVSDAYPAEGSVDFGTVDLDAEGIDDHIRVETPFGPYDAGSAAYDTDGDGRNDTVTVTGPAGGSALFTDVDGDGRADLVTEITGQGRITVSEHVGDGHWTVAERGQLGAGGSDEGSGVRADDVSTGFGAASSAAGSAGATVTYPPVSIDPHTGRWTQH